MGCNDVAICGKVVETSALRYTPAGVPVAEFKISHASRQIEAGQSRQVECEIFAVALGQMAEAVSGVETGISLKLTGFLARKSRMNPQLILHVNGIDFI